MKRFAVIAFALALALALAGCSQGAPGTTAASNESQQASEAPQGALADGVYDIEVETDSSMVNVVAAQLKVDGGAFEVTMSLNGEGFSRAFLGSAADAEAADGAMVHDYFLNDAGKYTFTFPVEVLDEGVDVALFGQRRDTWYDHVLVFHAPTGDPAPVDVADAPGADAAGGEHFIEVALEGGSGKATVESPARISIAEDGSMTAIIVWSSPNYDLMIVDGAEYRPLGQGGNSTFEIPVAALDADLPVQAETTAMSQPHLIDYTLRFDSGTLS